MPAAKFSRRSLIRGVSHTAAASVLLSPKSVLAAKEASLPAKAIGRPFPAGVQLPEHKPAQPNSESIGVALVGLGLYALGKMAPALSASKHCHLAGLVSGNKEKALRVASAYGLEQDAIYSYENFSDIAKDDRIDAIYIVLPSGLHADWTEEAFAAGKHVICEKPMALSASECQRMIRASKAANKKLMIGYRCHFEPNNLRARELMRDAVVGRPQIIRTDQHYVMGPVTPANNWRVNGALAGGGALEDYGIYGLQAALYLTDEMPTSVSAVTSTPADDPRFREIVNLQASRFSFPSGAIAQLSSSYNASWNDRVEVRGSNGIMMMNPATAYGGIKIAISSSSNDQEIERDPSHQFAAMMDHFGKSIKENSTIITDGAMGLRDVRLMEAIYLSASRKNEIRLNTDGSVKA